MVLNKTFLRQFVLYGVIGASSALLDTLVFNFLFHMAGLNEYLANPISVQCGIFMSFFLNRKYNFKKTDKVLRRFLLFYITGLLGLLLSQGILWLGTFTPYSVTFVKIVSVLIVAAVQFLINRVLAFSENESKEKTETK